MWLGSDATSMTRYQFEKGRLGHRAVLGVAGEEARHFLHNLLTADIASLTEGKAAYGALLTPQGKILFDMFVLAVESGLLIDCAASRKDDLVKRLMFYRLRAKVTIEERPDLVVGVAPAMPEASLRYPDPRDNAIGWRFFASPTGLSEARRYDEARIACGLADSDGDLGAAEVFPHEANFDQFGGVSFSKGCYIGQEVVSRMEHRGLARARILPVEFTGAVPAKGSEIRAGETVVGHLLSSSHNQALALLRLDRLAEAAGPLLTGGVSLRVLKPSFVRYAVPRATEDR
jgi:folate-binding protein YgfZ